MLTPRGPKVKLSLQAVHECRRWISIRSNRLENVQYQNSIMSYEGPMSEKFCQNRRLSYEDSWKLRQTDLPKISGLDAILENGTSASNSVGAR